MSCANQMLSSCSIPKTLLVRVKNLIQDIKDVEKQADGTDDNELIVLYDQLEGSCRAVLTIIKGIIKPIIQYNQ